MPREPQRPSGLRLWLRRRRGLVRPALRAGIAVALLGVVVMGVSAFAPAGGLLQFGSGFTSAARDAGLKITEIRIEGAENMPEPRIRAALGVKTGDPTLAFSPDAARQALEALPGTVVVRVSERRPFAIWQNQGRFSVVDRSGKVVATDRLDAFGPLPLIVGAGAEKYAAALYDQLREAPDVLARTQALVRVGERRWNLHLSNGMDVLLPEGEEKAAIRRLAEQGSSRVLGMFEKGLVRPVDRRIRADWRVPPGEENGAGDGDLVLAEPLPGHGLGLRPVRVLERLGRIGEPRSVSLVCIHAHGIPDAFDGEALRQAEHARGVGPEGREDLRDLPLVTIDGEDARDFDDAVHAEGDGKGWQVTVAIADVAHYVRPGSALDREARRRGNSVYFPDRVVPMLPEALSNGWCSLRPDEDRGCLFVRMHFDAEGRKQSHRFGRGLMRSTARLTYEAVQSAHEAGEARFDELYGAYRALLGAREKRGTLDLDLPERKVELSPEGKVLAVRPRARLDSHRLIEEFMVAANVCAAEELERLHQPCMYRVHDRPSDLKMEGLRQFLDTFGLSLPPRNELRPRDFAQLLEQVKDRPEERLVHETVLRAQSQAEYAPDNIGHFGLALRRYAHFTSPIRRYADLLVHRALIAGLRLGPDGLTSEEAQGFTETGEDITRTERRAAQAERDAVDRYLAAYMADHV
ncbi:MAG: cell division protein FtsQ/DivIB, partial [Roseomonas mucosa]|nr:cell division protein FtsQ/DivIB [Roseomonas mucosa]